MELNRSWRLGTPGILVWIHFVGSERLWRLWVFMSLYRDEIQLFTGTVPRTTINHLGENNPDTILS